MSFYYPKLNDSYFRISSESSYLSPRKVFLHTSQKVNISGLHISTVLNALFGLALHNKNLIRDVFYGCLLFVESLIDRRIKMHLKSEFPKNFRDESPALPLLPVSHITKIRSLLSILRDDLLGVIRKDGEPSLCVYYGPSSYQPRPNLDAISEQGHLNKPVGLILKEDVIPKASCMYPFDSGGYEEGFYQSTLIKHGLEAFRLEMPDQYCPARLVKRYFKNNELYVYGQPKAVIEGMHLEEEDIFRHYSDVTASADKDDRATKIELQFQTPLKFSDAIDVIVLPKKTYKDHQKDFSSLASYKKIFYQDNNRWGYQGHTGVLTAKISEYLDKKGYLGGRDGD